MKDQQIKKIVAEMLNSGTKLAEIQTILDREHGVKMKFFDLRMLAMELENIDWSLQDPVKKEEKKPEEPAKIAEAELMDSETRVTISKLVRPGAAISGDVVFKSGIKAEWYVDNYGRLGLNPHGEQNPDQEDLQEFQAELQRMISSGEAGY